MNIPMFDLTSPSEKLQMEIRDSIKNQLKTAEIQSKTSDKQYKLSIFLTIAAIIISLIPLTKDLLIKKTNYNESIIRIIDTQLKQSETISNMSIYLLDLQNQVKTLEKEKKELLKK